MEDSGHFFVVDLRLIDRETSLDPGLEIGEDIL